MSAQLFLPTPDCPCIGPAEVPFTHPDDVPRAVLGWVTEVANLTRPDEIHWWAGRWKERAALPHLRRGTGALAAPPLFDGCMRGRRMFVVPYSLTTVQDEPEQLGIEITDSPYVVLSLTAIARTGRRPLGQISAGQQWAPSVHSVGYPSSTRTDTRGRTSTGRATTRSGSPSSPTPRMCGPTAPARETDSTAITKSPGEASGSGGSCYDGADTGRPTPRAASANRAS